MARVVQGDTLITMLPGERLRVADAAAYLGLAKKTLDMYRCTGEGPMFIKRGKIFYYKTDLDTWLAQAPRQKQTVKRWKQLDLPLEEGTVS